MASESKRVWQVAAGQSGRFYSDLFCTHDLMLIGPGDFGPYSEREYRAAISDGLTPKGIVGNIRSFCEDVLPGDLVVMRNGLTVKGIGVVADAPYEWSMSFDDVYGWDLQHTRRVIWQDHLSPDIAAVQSGGPLFGSRKQIPTFTRLYDEAVLNPLSDIFAKIEPRELRSLPTPPPAPLTLDQVGQQLFAKGIANDAIEKVLAAIKRQRRLLEWYRRYGDASNRPTEHEVVAHTVLPLLLALGWSEQLLTVEWRNIDLACFWTTPSTSDNCVLVCEAKSRNHGLQDVKEQALAYVKNLSLSGCRKVLVTDGGRFYLYDRVSAEQEWSARAQGYLNVERIRTNHVAPRDTNAIDTIVALTPAGVVRPIEK